MHKFIILHSKDKGTSITEVEVEMISSVEDPSVMWLPKGEYKARVLEPASLYEKTPQGSLVAPVWHSHAFYETAQHAWTVAEEQIRAGFERELRKFGIAYTEQQVQEKLSQIREVKLP